MNSSGAAAGVGQAHSRDLVMPLVDCLMSAQNANPGTREAAERHLAYAEQQPGFGTSLVQTVIRADLHSEARQMAALLLKKYIKQHWSKEGKSFQEPAISEQEKASIRAELPQGLADPHSKIRTAVAMVVANIAKWEVPDIWPSLAPNLVGAITSQQNPALVSGSVRCLSMFVDELDEEQVVQVVPMLLPNLLSILAAPNAYDKSVQRRAIAIMHALVATCTNAVGPYKVQAKKVLLPHLEGWLQHFCIILGRTLTAESPTGDGMVKMEALKALGLLVTNMGKHLQPAMPAVLQQCWRLFVDCLPMYQHLRIDTNGRGEDAEVDSEGNTVDLSSLVAQLFEFLLSVASSSKTQMLLAGGLDQLINLTLGYMQMTREQEEVWQQDVNQFIADENELMFGVRTSGCLLIDELFVAFPGQTAVALASAVQNCFKEAAELKGAGNSSWWRLREAALMAVATVGEAVLDGPSQAHFQASALLDNVLQEDMVVGGAPTFLQGRAFWVASRLAAAVNAQQALRFLEAAAASVADGRPSLVQIGACRVILSLCTKVETHLLQPIFPAIYGGLCRLLLVFEEDALHLVLETLAALIRASPEAAATWQQQIVAPILQVWAAHAADPLLALQAVEVLEAMAAVPAALPTLQATVLPVLVSIASKAEANPPALVEGALDLATALLRPSTAHDAAVVHSVFTGTIMKLLQHQDDPGILQSCCEYLRVLISICDEDLFSYGGASPDATIREIISALQRLLQPEMGDSAPLYVGQVLTTVLQKIPDRALNAMADILPAAVIKLATSSSSPLITALLSVFAQLIHTNAVQLVEYLSATPSPVGGSSALDLLLNLWTERALEFQGIQDIKLSTTALGTLLATRHPAIASIQPAAEDPSGKQVKGRRLDIGTGIRTRSKAATQHEQWQWVPAPAKLFSLLADTLIEAKEGRLAEDDSDWEEVTDSEDDSAAPSSHAGMSLHGIGAAQSIPKSLLKAAMADGELTDRTTSEIEGPFANIDLSEYVTTQMRSLARQDQLFFESCCHLLSPNQLQAVKACF